MSIAIDWRGTYSSTIAAAVVRACRHVKFTAINTKSRSGGAYAGIDGNIALKSAPASESAYATAQAPKTEPTGAIATTAAHKV